MKNTALTMEQLEMVNGGSNMDGTLTGEQMEQVNETIGSSVEEIKDGYVWLAKTLWNRIFG